MGGRGARFGITPRGKKYPHKYGTEYKTVLQVGRIKFVKQIFDKKQKRDLTSPPQETKGKRRIYVTISKGGKAKSITFYRKGKIFAQVDFKHPHREHGKMLKFNHVHLGHNHGDKFSRNANKLERKSVCKNIVGFAQGEKRYSFLVKGWYSPWYM